MFLRHYRFSNAGFERLLGRIGHLLAHEDGRGAPISPPIQLQAALNHMAEAMFQRSTGLACRASQSAARNCLVRVVDALITLKGEFVFMPTP